MAVIEDGEGSERNVVLLLCLLRSLFLSWLSHFDIYSLGIYTYTFFISDQRCSGLLFSSCSNLNLVLAVCVGVYWLFLRGKALTGSSITINRSLALFSLISQKVTSYSPSLDLSISPSLFTVNASFQHLHCRDPAYCFRFRSPGRFRPPCFPRYWALGLPMALEIGWSHNRVGRSQCEYVACKSKC